MPAGHDRSPSTNGRCTDTTPGRTRGGGRNRARVSWRWLSRLFGRLAIVLAGVWLAAVPSRVEAANETLVVLGGYHFPPYVESKAPDGGLSLALMDALNSLESSYRFQFFKTSPGRRYADFRQGRYDVAFLESPAWGWRAKDIAFEATPPLLHGREVYVARAEAAATGDVFEAPDARRLAGMIGYHYAATEMEATPERLREDYDIMLNTSQVRNLRAVLSGRVDLAIVTEAFLDRYLDRHPDVAEQLAVGPEPDHTFTLHGLVRPESPIDAATLTRLLKRLTARGNLDPILARFRVARDWQF